MKKWDMNEHGLWWLGCRLWGRLQRRRLRLGISICQGLVHVIRVLLLWGHLVSSEFILPGFEWVVVKRSASTATSVKKVSVQGFAQLTAAAARLRSESKIRNVDH